MVYSRVTARDNCIANATSFAAGLVRRAFSRRCRYDAVTFPRISPPATSNTVSQDLVIGIGSPHGDDQVGWSVVAYLKQQGQEIAVLQTLVDPIDLIEQLDGVSRLLIVDGCRSGQEVGTLTRFDADDPRFLEATGHSTHRISLSETLDLARALRRLPGWVKVFGVEVDQCRPQAAMDPRLEKAVPRIAQEICDELSQRP